jgi:nicotinamide mononucleotide transporter
MLLASLALVVASSQGILRIDETFGFITGGVCVWLVVRQQPLNWPIGLLNNVIFFLLFLQSRLYADMGLQVVFFALGIYGWWNWLRRGPDNQPLQPSRAPRVEWLVMISLVVVSTFVLERILRIAGGASPLLDALTTSLSLAAQFWLCQKRIDNWLLWIAADLIYIPLYLSRELPLTAVLYGVFLVMCVLGWRVWKSRLTEVDHDLSDSSGDREVLSTASGTSLSD